MARSREDNRKKHPNVPRLSYSVDEFCVAVGISRSTYEKLKRANQHPREMRVSRKSVRISQTAAAEWIMAQEDERSGPGAAA